MASVDNVDFFVGPDWTSLGLPVPTVSERHQIPLVAENVATKVAYERGFKYLWGTPYPVVPLWSERYFDMLAKVEPKPKTIFFVTHDNPVMKAITDTWTKKAESFGLKIVGREVFPADTKDFSSIVLKVRPRSQTSSISPPLIMYPGHWCNRCVSSASKRSTCITRCLRARWHVRPAATLRE
jgi:hypothetical protein